MLISLYSSSICENDFLLMRICFKEVPINVKSKAILLEFYALN